MTYRNRDLLRLARLAPHCMGCSDRNDGQVVACHSNFYADGKGMGIKASDAAVAYCCNQCHTLIDVGGLGWSPQTRRLLWERAHIRTMRWLIESGHLVVAVLSAPSNEEAKMNVTTKRKVSKGPKLRTRAFPKGQKQKIPSRPMR